MPEFQTDSVEDSASRSGLPRCIQTTGHPAPLLLCSIIFSKDGHSSEYKDLDTWLDLELEH